MATEKMTKVEMFENIRSYLNGNEMNCSVDEAVEFIDKQIEQLEAKAAKAAEAKAAAAAVKVMTDEEIQAQIAALVKEAAERKKAASAN